MVFVPPEARDKTFVPPEAERLVNREFGESDTSEATNDQKENLVTVTTQEDYDKIEEGQEYIYNGQVLTKGA